jgi:phage terminase large subunit-like protein
VLSDLDDVALAAGCRYRPELAQHAIGWIEGNLCHSLGSQWAGRPFILAPWQRELIGRLFGWVTADGARRYRYCDVWVPVKNGKSTLGAAIGLYLLIGDGEPGAHVYSVAYDREQAGLVHGEAIRMVERSDRLTAVTRINRTNHTILFPHRQGLYRTLSHDPARQQGLNIHGAICDEIHVWPGDELWSVLTRRTAARLSPLIVCFSTAGIVDPESWPYCRYLEDKQILAGTLTDYRRLVCIYEASDDDNPMDPATWRKANPSLDITISSETLAEEAAEAGRSPRALGHFWRYNLDLWLQSGQAWLDLAAWDACAGPLSLDDFAGAEMVYAGLDLASVDDLAALAVVAKLADRIAAWCWFWAPQEGAQRRQDDGLPLLRWAEQAHIELHPGSVIDLERIEQFILSLTDRLPIREIGYDPYQALGLATRLERDWGLRMVACTQSTRHYNEPCRSLEGLISSRQLLHSGHPILRWNASNAQLKENVHGQVMPVKAAKRAKIDGLMCLLMALGRMLFSEVVIPKVT